MSDLINAINYSAYDLLLAELQEAILERLQVRNAGRVANSPVANPSQTQHARGTTDLPPSAFDNLIEQASQRYGVDEDLVRAVIKVESNFDPDAVSHAGAKGLMQLMDATAAGLGVENSFDAAQNIQGGVAYLAQQLQRFNGNVDLALAAYNAGPGAVTSHGGIPPYAETQNYVKRVLSFYSPDHPRVDYKV